MNSIVRKKLKSIASKLEVRFETRYSYRLEPYDEKNKAHKDFVDKQKALDSSYVTPKLLRNRTEEFHPVNHFRRLKKLYESKRHQMDLDEIILEYKNREKIKRKYFDLAYPGKHDELVEIIRKSFVEGLQKRQPV